MRAFPIILATGMGLAIGVAGTWFVLHRSPAPTNMSPSGDKQALYWYDPMVPDQHFDKPGKSPFMDMQLVPKYAGGSNNAGGVVSIDPREVQNLGVRTAKAEHGTLTTTVRATGTVAFDERAVEVVQARVSGIVERLDVRAPLTSVKRGQSLLALLAPDWTAAQEEYLSLRRSRAQGLDALRAAARQRLLLLGMSEAQIRAIEQSGRAQTQVVVTSPRDGVIGELSVREGASVMPGTPLLRINGLDDVWINAAIPEAQVARVSTTSSVDVELPAFPGKRLSGRIDALLPDIDPTTRTQTARIVVDNPERLAPGMFARVEISASSEGAASVLVPTEAVIATGTRSVVIVDDGKGRFRAQEVQSGDEAGGKTQVLDGIKEGETVVLSGQFLIDSEASLSGTLTRLSGGGARQSNQPTSSAPASGSAAPAREVHLAQGTVSRIDGDRWTIDTDAVPSLDMSAMAMTFVCPQQIPRGAIRLGQRVSFSFFRNPEGEFEIEKITVLETAEPATPKGGRP